MTRMAISVLALLLAAGCTTTMPLDPGAQVPPPNHPAAIPPSSGMGGVSW